MRARRRQLNKTAVAQFARAALRAVGVARDREYERIRLHTARIHDLSRPPSRPIGPAAAIELAAALYLCGLCSLEGQ